MIRQYYGDLREGKLLLNCLRSRESITSKWDQPAGGFLLVDVSEVIGIESTYLKFLMAGAMSLRQTVKAFLERGEGLAC